MIETIPPFRRDQHTFLDEHGYKHVRDFDVDNGIVETLYDGDTALGTYENTTNTYTRTDKDGFTHVYLFDPKDTEQSKGLVHTLYNGDEYLGVYEKATNTYTRTDEDGFTHIYLFDPRDTEQSKGLVHTLYNGDEYLGVYDSDTDSFVQYDDMGHITSIYDTDLKTHISVDAPITPAKDRHSVVNTTESNAPTIVADAIPRDPDAVDEFPMAKILRKPPKK